MAGISFCSNELIEVSLDTEDENAFPLSEQGNRKALLPAINLGYKPISI